jgi:hypothetical protein
METMDFLQQQHLEELHSSCIMLERQYHAAPDIFRSEIRGTKEMQLSVTREAISICLEALAPLVHNDPNMILKDKVVAERSSSEEHSGWVELKYYAVKHNRYETVSVRYCSEEGHFPIGVWLVREKTLDAWFDSHEQTTTSTESAQEEPYVVHI